MPRIRQLRKHRGHVSCLRERLTVSDPHSRSKDIGPKAQRMLERLMQDIQPSVVPRQKDKRDHCIHNSDESCKQVAAYNAFSQQAHAAQPTQPSQPCDEHAHPVPQASAQPGWTQRDDRSWIKTPQLSDEVPVQPAPAQAQGQPMLTLEISGLAKTLEAMIKGKVALHSFNTCRT